MTIKLITAPPRTGKSLYAVHHLNKERESLFVISNIDGYNSDVKISNADEFKKFIIDTNWEELTAKNKPKKTIVVIDEAQQIYGSVGMTDQQKMLFFLEYHGHYGINIWLITHSIKSLATRVPPLISENAEVSKIKAGKNTRRVKIKCPISDEIIETETFTASESDYNSYKSAKNAEGLQTNRTPLKRILILLSLSIITVLIGAYYSINSLKPSEQNKDLKQNLNNSLNNNLNNYSNPALKELKPEPKNGIEKILKIEKARLTGMVKLNYNKGKSFNPLLLKNVAYFNKDDCSLNSPRIVYCEEFDFNLNIALCNKELYYLDPCDSGDKENTQLANNTDTNSLLTQTPSAQTTTLNPKHEPTQ